MSIYCRNLNVRCRSKNAMANPSASLTAASRLLGTSPFRGGYNVKPPLKGEAVNFSVVHPNSLPLWGRWIAAKRQDG